MDSESNKAFDVLEEGVKLAPAATDLWHWLASYRSDLRRYDAAFEAFEREAVLTTHTSANTYNMAVLLERVRKPKDALDQLDQLERPDADGPSAAHFAELRARLLFELGNFEQSIVEATAAIEKSIFVRGRDSKDLASLNARSYAVRADAYLQNGRTDNALSDVMGSLICDRNCVRAYSVLRRIDNRAAKEARIFEMTFEGLSIEDGRAVGQFVKMTIVASDEAEAIEYAQRLTPVVQSLKLNVRECTDLGAADPSSLSGVMRCGQSQTSPIDSNED